MTPRRPLGVGAWLLVLAGLAPLLGGCSSEPAAVWHLECLLAGQIPEAGQ